MLSLVNWLFMCFAPPVYEEPEPIYIATIPVVHEQATQTGEARSTRHLLTPQMLIQIDP